MTFTIIQSNSLKSHQDMFNHTKINKKMDGLKNKYDIEPGLTKEVKEEEIPFEEKVKGAESNIIIFLTIMFWGILILAFICYMVAEKGSNIGNSVEAELKVTSISIAIIDIVSYLVIKPFVVILIGISQNLREINKKLK